MCEAQDRQSINFNRHHREVDLKEGDFVMLHKDAYQPESGTKFHNLWSGPFRIIKKLSSETYNQISKQAILEDMINLILRN